mgnify:CR=1 FL=1
MRPLLLALLLLAAPAAAQESLRTLTVTGEGRATAVPDLARLSLGVAVQAATAGEAMSAMGEGVSAILQRLQGAGIEARDVQTGQLSLQAVYDYNSYSGTGVPPLLGFLATQMLDVRVRDVAGVGPVLDATVADGANQINGVTFDLADPAAALDEARRAAVADAAARAETYAAAAGVALGDVVSVAETTFGPVMPLYDGRMAADAAAPVPVAPGELAVTATVSVTYAIE